MSDIESWPALGASPLRASPLDGGAVPPAPELDEPACAPNRTLDLAELERPDYRYVLAHMDAILEATPGAYLHPGKRWEYPWALEQAALRAGERVLDVGCGRSIFPLYLAAAGMRVTALDLEVDDALSRPLGLSVDWVPGDMTALPLPGAAFDAVFCISVIEHLPDAQAPRAMAELHRVLRPGGRLLLTTDLYDDASAEIWYEGADRRFQVDWAVFDEARLRRLILAAPGFALEGTLDLSVDWEQVKPRMREYHGYPYTSVGVKLIRI